jgi:hypothetical protein
MINGHNQAAIPAPLEGAIDGPSTVANNDHNEDDTGAQDSKVLGQDNQCSHLPPSSIPMHERIEGDELCVSDSSVGSGLSISDNSTGGRPSLSESVFDRGPTGEKPANDATVHNPWDPGFQGLTAYEQAVQRLYSKFGAECDERLQRPSFGLCSRYLQNLCPACFGGTTFGKTEAQ